MKCVFASPRDGHMLPKGISACLLQELQLRPSEQRVICINVFFMIYLPKASRTDNASKVFNCLQNWFVRMHCTKDWARSHESWQPSNLVYNLPGYWQAPFSPILMDFLFLCAFVFQFSVTDYMIRPSQDSSLRQEFLQLKDSQWPSEMHLDYYEARIKWHVVFSSISGEYKVFCSSWALRNLDFEP